MTQPAAQMPVASTGVAPLSDTGSTHHATCLPILLSVTSPTFVSVSMSVLLLLCRCGPPSPVAPLPLVVPQAWALQEDPQASALQASSSNLQSAEAVLCCVCSAVRCGWCSMLWLRSWLRSSQVQEQWAAAGVGRLLVVVDFWLVFVVHGG